VAFIVALVLEMVESRWVQAFQIGYSITPTVAVVVPNKDVNSPLRTARTFQMGRLFVD